MADPWKPPTHGALDDTQWPEKLVAKTALPGANDDRLHGYALLGDVARNYSFADLLYLSLCGELPDGRSSTLFEIALCSFGTMSVSEAPTHVAVLGRICGGAFSSALGAGLVTLADHARFLVESQSALLAWLGAPTTAQPDGAARSDPWVDTLLETLAAKHVHAQYVHAGMSRDAARIALLFEAGLRTHEQLQAAIVASRLCGLSAEALVAGPSDLGNYPVKLPPFHYVEDES